MAQRRIPAVYMRGGTSKGVFFLAADLPADPVTRDALLLRVIGSPDPYGKHIDGMGGATSSTSKVALVSPSLRPDCDVEYLFGAVAVDRPVIDWSGNCGNLTAAVGPFAVSAGLLNVPRDGLATVRIWQANIGKRIIAHVPVRDGELLEEGDFRLDGVAFPGAEVVLDFLDPAGAGGGSLFPSGRLAECLEVPGVGNVEATLIDAGNPTIFVMAESLGLRGDELPAEINGNRELLARVEAIRAHATVAMGLAATAEEATARRPATPKLAFLALPRRYAASDGRIVEAQSIDLLVRIFSFGQLHHAMTGTGAVALGAAVAIPGTLAARLASPGSDGRVRFGHPSGTMNVGATVGEENGRWTVEVVSMSRSARRLMEGWVRVPA